MQHVQQMNPSQIALAAARNLGVYSALPAQQQQQQQHLQQQQQSMSSFGGAALGGPQSNPQLLAQLLRTGGQQQQAGQAGQCECAMCFLPLVITFIGTQKVTMTCSMQEWGHLPPPHPLPDLISPFTRQQFPF